MQQYILRRVFQMLPVFLIAVVINFFLISAAPGDPAVVLAGENAPRAYVEELRASYNLDAPIWERLWKYLLTLFQGDLGFSYAYRQPVLSVILSRVPATLLLVFASQGFAIVLGSLLGAVAAWQKNRLADRVISYGTLVLYCLPVFWLGLMLILIFAVHLRVLPSSGMYSFMAWDTPRWLDVARHLILPASCLFLYTLPIYVRLTRSTVLEVAQEDYVTTARAIGFRERTVYLRYALRNALLPTVSVAGLSLSSLLTGALLVETVFAWPGLGRLVYDAVGVRDYPVLMGGFVFATVLVIVGSLITDVIYTMLDPRVAYS